jgi:uncharacterized protein (DUF983 family)
MLVKITSFILFLLGFLILGLMWFTTSSINEDARLKLTIWVAALLTAIAFNLYTQIKNK